MRFRCRKESNKVCAARAHIIDGKRLRAGRAADVNDFAGLSFKTNERSLPIAKNRTEDQQPFTGFILQFQSKARMSLKPSGVC
jgi:hypothetical protein